MTHEEGERDTEAEDKKIYHSRGQVCVSERERNSATHTDRRDDLNLHEKMLYMNDKIQTEFMQNASKPEETAAGFVNSLPLNVGTEFEYVLFTGHFKLVGEAEVLHLNLDKQKHS